MSFGFWRQFISVLWIYADWVRIVRVVFGSFLQHSRLLPCKPIHRLISVYTQFDVSHGNEVLCGLITEVKLSISVNDLSQLAQGFLFRFVKLMGSYYRYSTRKLCKSWSFYKHLDLGLSLRGPPRSTVFLQLNKSKIEMEDVRKIMKRSDNSSKTSKFLCKCSESPKTR